MSDSRFLVYGLTDPRTGAIRYIGKSSSGMRRPAQHGHASRLRDATHKSAWIKALRAEGFDYGVEVLTRLDSPRALSDEERGWIAIGRVEGWDLTNATDGGDGQSRDWRPSEAQRRAVAEANRRRVHTREERERRSVGIRAAIAAGRFKPGKRFGPLSEETKRKLSEARKGRSIPPEIRAKIGAAGRGRKATPEARANMSAAQRGRKRTIGAEARARLAAAAKARVVSAETRAKLSAAGKGRRLSEAELAERRARKLSPEHRARFTFKGRRQSPEARAKMVEAWKRRRAAKAEAEETNPSTVAA